MSDIRPPRAVHAQIADELRDQILRGVLAAGAPLPSEGDYAAHYGVSRVTVNRAVAELRREHLVEVRRGVGTFVAAGDTVRYGGLEFPRAVWAAVSAAADRDDVTVEAWIVGACRERLEREQAGE